MELKQNSSRLIYEQLKAGISTADIKKNMKVGKKRLTDMFTIYAYSENSSKGICFGSKTVPYYDCEDSYIDKPKYRYSDLSKSELEFYESSLHL